MARNFAKLFVSIWRDADFIALDRHVQWTYFLLVSQPDLSPAGLLPWRPSKWAKGAADASIEGIVMDCRTLACRRFVVIDDHTEELLVRAFIRRDEGFRTPNIQKAIVSAIARIESNELQAIATVELHKAAACKASESHPEQSNQQLSNPPGESTQQSTTASDLDAMPGTETHDAIAVDAVEILVMHRLLNPDPDKPIRNPKPYAEKIRRNAFTEYGAMLAGAFIPDNADPARHLAMRVLGLSSDQARAAQAELNRREGTAA